MRIAFVVKSFPALSETFVLNQVTGLMDQGHEVDIYARSSRDDGGIVHEDIEKYGLLDRTFYQSAVPPGIGKRIAWLISGSAALIAREPSLISHLWPPRHWAGMLRAAEPLRSGSTEGPYDIVHCHFGRNGWTGLLMKHLGMAKHVVVTFHGYELSKGLTSQRATEYRRMARKVDVMSPISERWRDKLIGLGCPPGRIIVHRMGIDTEGFRFAERAPSRPLKLLAVGRLVEKKGIEYAIRALCRLRERAVVSDVELTVVGDGPLRPGLENLSRQLGLDARLRFVGWRPQGWIRKQMHRAHVMILPSVTAANGDQEGIPVTLMEAMATGMPVVSTRHSGIPELVVDGESGFLVPERDPEALADRLARFVERPELLAAMGHAGRLIVERDYDIARLNGRLSTLYRYLLEGGESADFEAREEQSTERE